MAPAVCGGGDERGVSVRALGVQAVKFGSGGRARRVMFSPDGLLTLIAGVVQKRAQVGFGAEGVAGGQRQPRRDGVRPALPLGATTFRSLNGAEQLHGRARAGPSTTGLHQILNARMMIG